MKILVISGPNLNMLGSRDPAQYGTLTLEQLQEIVKNEAEKQHAAVSFFQSNHEGALIDFLQKESTLADGILINPGALTHYSYALRDALTDTTLPVVEVHLSDITRREDFRKVDVIRDVAIATFMGEKEESYRKGLHHLIAHVQKNTVL